MNLDYSPEDKTAWSIEQLVIDVVSEFSIIRKINKTLFIMTILEEKNLMTKELKTVKTQIMKIYENPESYRLMGYRDALLSSNRVEYFGKDYGKDDAYKYNKKVEDFVFELNRIIINILAKAYLKLRTSEEQTDISQFEV